MSQLSETADHDDLRTGLTPWARPVAVVRKPVRADLSCDVVIVGAGITGAMTAQHLAARGVDTIVIDREKPGRGSTAASTAMLLWEIDTPLRELAAMRGFDTAAALYRRSFAAAAGLWTLVHELGLPCGMMDRASVYLASQEVTATDLAAEHQLRRHANLPGDLLDHTALLSHFGMAAAGAIVSPGSAEADPVLLAHGLLNVATARGARVFDAEAIDYHEDSREAVVVLDAGHIISARHVVLATGYAVPDFITSHQHQIVSTWAIATRPQPDRLWRDRALVWEASQDYFYARTTSDGRIVMGGGDDPVAIEPAARDALMPAKRKALEQRLGALWPDCDSTAETVWGGAFGKTRDGLPLIGSVPGRTRTHAAYGYGGNGITFSYLASRMIGQLVEGQAQNWFDDYAFDRDSV